MCTTSKPCVCPKCHGSRLIEQISKKKVIEQKDILELISVIYNNIKEKGKTFVVSEHNAEFYK